MAALRHCLARPGLVIAFLAASCFSPEYQEGVDCSTTGLCPRGQGCSAEGVCVRSSQLVDGAIGSDAMPDASTELDASPEADADPCAGDPGGTQTFDYSGLIDSFVVPECAVVLTIEAFGAQGGGSFAGEVGGKGARMKGDFVLTPGSTLMVLVGQQGVVGIQKAQPNEQGGGTGGGGTFVVASDDTPLLIAGGGGGASHVSAVDGGPGQTGPDGQAGSGTTAGAGGTGGAGGVTGTNGGFHNGTGGGGFSGDGVNDSVGLSMWGTPNHPGTSYLNGGAGGVGGSLGRDGGFGGGGSAGYTGGGGGGYSGGGGGGHDASYGGGGGGSYNAGTNPSNTEGFREGDGQVIFSW